MVAFHSDLVVLQEANERNQNRISPPVLSRRYESATLSYMLHFYFKALTSLYEIETPSPNLDFSTVTPSGGAGNCAYIVGARRSHAPRESTALKYMVNSLCLHQRISFMIRMRSTQL